MQRETLAAIDIGSNAIRLLIKYAEQDKRVSFKRAAFVRVPIRLGEDVFSAGAISEKKREKLCNAMRAFSALMITFGVKRYRACATSAMREAGNGAEIVDYISRECGVNIEIISGQEEAKTIFEAGDISGYVDSDKSFIYVDVGGGSTELTIYSNNKRVASESFRLGTVRTLSNGMDKDEQKRLKVWLEQVALPTRPTTIIGSGGNINKVHKLLSKKEGEGINYVEIKLLYDQLKDMTFEERCDKMGMNLYRADVIIPAMKIFCTVAKSCRINEIQVPKIGLADGVIHHLYYNK